MNVACARIDSGAGGLLKPNPYVEVIVDGKPPKKTETVKSTYQPKWETDMTVVVTPFSKILYRLFDHSSFKKDAVLGEHTMDLYTVLKKHQGKLQSTTVSADLYQTVAQKSGSASAAGGTTQQRVSLLKRSQPPPPPPLGAASQSEVLLIIIVVFIILIHYTLPGSSDKRLTGNGEELSYSCTAGCN